MYTRQELFERCGQIVVIDFGDSILGPAQGQEVSGRLVSNGDDHFTLKTGARDILFEVGDILFMEEL